MKKITLIFILSTLLFSGCYVYKRINIHNTKKYQMPGARGGGIPKSKCERIFTSPRTDGFVGVSTARSVLFEIVLKKATLNWKKALLDEMPSHLKEICMYNWQLRRKIRSGKMTDTLFYRLTDSLISHYPNSILHTCDEVSTSERKESSRKFYAYYVVEYHYPQFIKDLRELSNNPEWLPIGISKKVALQIASITEKIAEPLGEHIWMRKCSVWE